MLYNTVFKRQLYTELLRHELKRTPDSRAYLVRLDRLEFKHRAAAYYRVIHIKVRIFGS